LFCLEAGRRELRGLYIRLVNQAGIVVQEGESDVLAPTKNAPEAKG
jgi:hypothetical protein